MTARGRFERLARRDVDGLTLYVAGGFASRLRGLMALDRLPDGHGLLFERCGSIHTFGMRFALDLVWLDRAGRVVRVDRDVGPRRLRICRGARSVVEANAGEGGRFAAALGGAPRA